MYDIHVMSFIQYVGGGERILPINKKINNHFN